MEEIQRLDFSKMDFSEFMDELMVKFTDTYKTPKTEEVASTIINVLVKRQAEEVGKCAQDKLCA